jgi:protocatechuate 3,4-dioxygenase beta subunit
VIAFALNVLNETSDEQWHLAQSFVETPLMPHPDSSRLRAALLFVAGVALLCVPTVHISAAAPPQSTSSADGVKARADDVSPDSVKIRVAGDVVADDGKPIARATVYLRPMESYQTPFAQAVTDAQGKFRFDGVTIPSHFLETFEGILRGEVGTVEMVVVADGFAMSWRTLEALATDEPIHFKLSPEAKITGIVHDKAGRGIAGASVQVFGISPSLGNVDPFLIGPGDLRLGYNVLLSKVQTDGDGRFTLHNLPANQRAFLKFEGRGFRTSVCLHTGDPKDLSRVGFKGAHAAETKVVGLPIDIIAEPKRYVRVKVVDHENKRPDGGELSAFGKAAFDGGSGFTLDASGEAFVPIKEPGRYTFHFWGDKLRPTLGASKTVDIPAGEDNPVVELRLPEPRWLTGRLLDSETGKGIVGVPVSYTANPESKDVAARNFSQCVSDAEGRFRIPVATGPGGLTTLNVPYGYLRPPVMVRTPTGFRQSFTAVDVPATGEIKPITLSLTRGLTIRGIVRKPNGQPTAEATLYCSEAHSRCRPDKDGRFQMSGLDPRGAYSFTVWGVGGATQFTVEAAPDHPSGKSRIKEVDVLLEPRIQVSGRTVFKDKPVAGVRVSVQRIPPRLGAAAKSKGPTFLGATTTDAKGEFHLDCVAEGDSFYLRYEPLDDLVVMTSRNAFSANPGTKDIKVGDVQLLELNQTLRGVVVDPKGKPLAGMRVAVMNARFQAPPDSGRLMDCQTDGEGRFELRGLPATPLELIASRPMKKDGRIAHSAKANPKINDQEIKIVYDPELDGDLEDLDAKKPPVIKKP